MKFCKFISLILAAVMILCAFPVSAAENDTVLNAVAYGTVNRYTATENGNTVVGGISYPDSSTVKYIQSLSSMREIGFADRTNIPFITYFVVAPEDGNYTVSPRFYLGGAVNGNSYSMTLAVNDRVFYSSESVNSAGWYTPQYTVALSKGVNTLRFLTFTSETYYIFKNSTVWLNHNYLKMDASLQGVYPGSPLVLASGKSQYINNFKNINTNLGTLGGVYTFPAKSAKITYDNMSFSDLADMPYFAYTLNVPKSGYYDISLEFYTGQLGSQAFFTVFVDRTKYKCNFIDTKAWYTSNNISVYLPEGNHTLTVTAALGAKNDYYRDWCDFANLTISGGVTLAQEQTFPEYNGYTVINADKFYMHNYSLDADNRYAKAVSAGEPFDGETGFPKSDNSYAAIAVCVPSDGEYNLELGVKLQTEFANSDIEPYASLLVNGKYYKAYFNALNEDASTVPVTVNLNRGVNSIYILSTDLEMSAEYSDFSMQYSYVKLPASVDAASADMYLLGDINADTYVDIRDLLRIKRYIADNKTDCYAVAANVNGDNLGNIDADDMVALKKLLISPTPDKNNELKCDFITNNSISAIETGYSYSNGVVRQDASENVYVYNAGQLNNDDDSAVIYINADEKFQEIDGFGGALDDSTCYNLAKRMSADMRSQVLNSIFDKDSGLGLNIVRLPCGVNDFAMNWHTYDDMPQGSEDWSLENFSIEADKAYIIPTVKSAQSINSEIQFISSVWSPPLWMKTKYSWITTPENNDYSVAPTESNTAMLRTECYDVFAQYLIKFIKAYEELGINISSITPQNELTGRHGIPSTYYTSQTVAKLVNYHIVPAFKSAGITTEIWGWDFNYFGDTVKEYVNAQRSNIRSVAFHNYDGDDTTIEKIHSMFPELKIQMTETGSVDPYSYMSHNATLTNRMFRFGASSLIRWCLVLDEYNGPSDSRNPHLKTSPVEKYSNGVITYNAAQNKVIYNPDAYFLAHYSRYIDRGAYYIGSTDIDSSRRLSSASFLNPDNTVVTVLSNDNSGPVTFKCVFNGRVIVYRLSGKSVATLKWQSA